MSAGLRRGGLTSTAFCLFLSVAVVGCGKGSGTVSGKVTFDGKPVPGGSITFVCFNEDGKVQTSRTAQIEKDGSYSVAKIPEGPVKITIVGSQRGMPARFANRMRSASGELKNVRVNQGGEEVEIPPRYGDENKTDLSYTVTRGSQQHDVALTK